MKAILFATGGEDVGLGPLLQKHEIAVSPCRDYREVSDGLGGSPGLLIAAAELLGGSESGSLTRWLAAQPAWSDLAVILIANRATEHASELVGRFGNVTLVERPVESAAFLTLVEAALRSRRRQHDMAELLHRLGESETRFAATFENAAVGIGHVAPDGRWLRVNRTLALSLGWTPADLLGGDSRNILHADDRPRYGVLLDELMAGTDNVRIAEARLIRKDGSVAWVELSGDLARASDGSPWFSVWIADDISARRRAAEQRRTLLRELSHRVKNTLAVIQAMAKQTARTTISKQDFLATFEGRIAGLAHTHNVLTDADWSGADLRTLIERQLLVLGGEGAGQVEIEGPSVLLPPAGATSFAMVVHELTTNARKHGALSVPAGRLQVRWSVIAGPEGQHLDFVWRETNGPLVRKPGREGFGIKLLRSSGKVDVRYSSGGFECDIDVPLRPDSTFVEPPDSDGLRTP